MDAPVLAIDIGGSKCAVALVQGGRLLHRSQRPTPASEGPKAVVAAAVAAAQELLSRGSHRPTALGVACAGRVIDGHVWAVSPDLLSGWSGFPVVRAFGDALGLRTTALNDAQAAAWGEASHGAGVGRRSLLFVTVSTGVGGGLVLDGRLWQGHEGLAGHIGHLQADPAAEGGSGGRRGTLESLASGTALARQAASLGHVAADAREVITQAESGAAWARTLVGAAADALAQALADAKALVDPELVVLGGGVGLNPVFQRELAVAVARLPEIFRTKVVTALLGADAGLVGAAAWALSSREP